MKKYIIHLTLGIIPFILLQTCSPGPKTFSQENDRPGTSIPNMKTPTGARLLPAQEGPVRSAYDVPVIDLNTFRLEISGLVDSSFSLTWDQITRLSEYQTDTILMYCVEGWEVWGRWEGIRVKDLLDIAGVQPSGKYVLFTGIEGYTTSLSISYLIKYNALLAYNVNSYPLKPEDGFPLRLIAFGKFGYKWIKWVNRLKVIDKSQLGFWEDNGFPDEANVPLARRQYYEGKMAIPLSY
jgi:DMSO/TMAO reductase YedYZ molybdopterin-dependent catalytic subunit